MDTVNMHAFIVEAQQHEQRTRELASLLAARQDLTRRIDFANGQHPLAMLIDFITRFVERTPKLLDDLNQRVLPDPVSEIADQLIHTCTELFIAPPPLLNGKHGLNGAMCRAFLCQRLFEDINDTCTVRLGNPLLMLDITRSNLWIHHLIGEPYAALLEELIYLLSSRLIERMDFNHRFDDENYKADWNHHGLDDCLGSDLPLSGSIAGGLLVH
jgi:hypothetical protein